MSEAFLRTVAPFVPARHSRSEDVGSVRILPVLEIRDGLQQRRGERETEGGNVLDADEPAVSLKPKGATRASGARASLTVVTAAALNQGPSLPLDTIGVLQQRCRRQWLLFWPDQPTNVEVDVNIDRRPRRGTP